MQDIEFTIQEGKLYLLQCRNGKRTAKAAVKIAVDLYNEGIIDKDQALCLVDPNAINQLLHRQIDPKATKTILSRGLNASQVLPAVLLFSLLKMPKTKLKMVQLFY